MLRFFSVLGILCVFALFLLFPVQAEACLAPSSEDHHYPSCIIPTPEASEVVSVVTAGGFQPSSTVHVGEPTSPTALVTVDIAPNMDKHFIVLEAHRQAIWKFEGDIESVSRVIVLGAKSLGPWAAGVIGVPEDRVFFTEPDLSLLVLVGRTSCTRIGKSCIAAQWFGQAPSERVTFHPQPGQARMHVDAFARSMYSRNPDWPVTVRSVERTTEPVVVDPAVVIAPRGAASYEQRTGQAGLDDLVTAGALLSAGDPRFDTAVRTYSETFSARYRTRFDPDYLFVPQIDYVVTQSVTLPAGIPYKTFLLAPGVPLPDMNGNGYYRSCFLAMDHVSRPAEKYNLKSPYCREGSIGMRNPDDSVFRAALYADLLRLEDNCQQDTLPADAEIVVLNVMEEGRQRYKGDKPRQIEVHTKTGDDPLVLYLHTSGGPARWNLHGDQIARVYKLRAPKYELDVVTLNGSPHKAIRLGIDRDDCPFFAPYTMELRGPAYYHLDAMIETLLGKSINRLLEVQADASGKIQIEID